MAESRRMGKTELFTHFAERVGIKRTEAGEFFDELQQLTEQELLRCGEFVLPGVAKLVVQQREKRMGRNPATGARVEIPAKQVVKARINQTQPIFLIVDQHSSHRAKAVQEFVASTDGHLELFFLPPYSPELNPDELVWNHLKTHGVRKRLLQTPQELKRYVLGHMRSLQRTPALLRGFFKKPSLRYITA